jgi:hypothetical protein
MITTREIDEKDLIPLAEFLIHEYPFKLTKESWFQKFDIWWASNPAFTPHLPRGWILEEDTQIIGFIGNVPIKYEIQGDMKIGTAASDWFVKPSIRGMFSINLFKKFINQDNPSLFLFRTKTENIKKILIKYGFNESVARRYPLEYVYIINRKKLLNRKNMSYFLFNYFSKSRIGNQLTFLESLKKMGIFVYSFLFETQLGRIKDHTRGAYTTSLCSYCDESFANLWKPILNEYSVNVSRDKNTLNWLYFSAGKSYNRIVLQCQRSSDNSLAGYMVFDFIARDLTDGGAMQLMEMCIPNNDEQILTSLISFAIEIGKQNKVLFLIFWANCQQIDIFFQNSMTLTWNTQCNLNFLKFQGIEINSNDFCMYSSAIEPPWRD